MRFAAALLLLAVVAVAWRWTTLHDWIAVESLVSKARDSADSPSAAVAVLAAYVMAGLVVAPITVLIVATGAVFGPFVGGVYALGGAVLSAAVTYAVGRRLGRDTVRRLAGSRLNAITLRLARKGVMAVAVMRALPIAPFSVVNAVAGASHVGLREFLLGTAIGMAPGVGLTVIFVDRVSTAITHPGPLAFAALAAVAVIVGGAAVFVWRRLGGGHGPIATKRAR